MRAHVALGTVAWTDAIDISPDTLYLLIEFQSSIDRFMAVRIANFLTLLYQDLIEQKQLTATEFAAGAADRAVQRRGALGWGL
jgi:hypothetical protein